VGIWRAAAASQWFGRNANMAVNGNLGYARGLMLGGLQRGGAGIINHRHHRHLHRQSLGHAHYASPHALRLSVREVGRLDSA
jgi:hypothetical protein